MQTARIAAVLSHVPEPRSGNREVQQQRRRYQGAVGAEQLLAGQHHHSGESGERVGRAAVFEQLPAGAGQSTGDHLQQRGRRSEQRVPDGQRSMELGAEPTAERINVVV